MTPAEIASSIGSDPSPIGRLSRAIEHRGTWHTAAWDESNPPLLVTDKPDVDVWADEYAVIEVRYLNGKAVVKTMDVRLSQAQGWLRWLRRHVGW
jgi:hypothetical protein